jgi:excinuclease ABC subunit A
LPIDEALAFFSTLNAGGWRGEIATKIVKEIASGCASWSMSASTT